MVAYLYFRTNSELEFKNLCKKGFTEKNPFHRNKEYIKHELEQGHFILIIAVSIHIVEALNTTLTSYFNHLSASVIDEKYNGGTEFFSIDIIDQVQEFLVSNYIKHHILTTEEINKLHEQFLAEENVK